MQKKTSKEDILYLKNIEKIKHSEEYKQNELQISCIKDVLIQNADVPEKLIDWLIEAVEKNAVLISKANNK